MSTSILMRMSKDLLMPAASLDQIIQSAPYRYKIYNIPKKSGTGLRTIAQPAKEVKRIQYWVIENILSNVKIHSAATAYMRGKNILTNASPHSDQSYLLKVDFKDFFTSIKERDFVKYSKDNNDFELSAEDVQRLVRVLFWSQKRGDELNLSIGAPSSPLLSNALMFEFDNLIFDFCSNHNIFYTRYSDDITLSMNDKAMRSCIFEKIKSILSELKSPKLHLNTKKTVFASKAHRRLVTGLVLANNGSISLGREKKRKIRTQIHYFTLGKLSDDEMQKLQGMLSFVRDIEPDFIKRMEKKYGRINEIFNKKY
jgi:RNA-directed DNA polymerase